MNGQLNLKRSFWVGVKSNHIFNSRVPYTQWLDQPLVVNGETRLNSWVFLTVFPGGYFSKYQTIGVKLGCRCSKRLLLKFEGTSLYDQKNFRESVFHSRNDVAFKICLKLKRIDLLLVSRPWQTVNNGYFLRIFAWIKHISWYKLYKHNTADNVNILSTQN